MRGFLRDPFFRLYAGLRWHWREVVMTTVVVWGVLMIALVLLTA